MPNHSIRTIEEFVQAYAEANLVKDLGERQEARLEK
jgi:hypothetical protein